MMSMSQSSGLKIDRHKRGEIAVLVTTHLLLRRLATRQHKTLTV